MEPGSGEVMYQVRQVSQSFCPSFIDIDSMKVDSTLSYAYI